VSGRRNDSTAARGLELGPRGDLPSISSSDPTADQRGLLRARDEVACYVVEELDEQPCV